MKRSTTNLAIIATYLICFSVIGWTIHGASDRKREDREKLKTFMYEAGYIQGAHSGAKLIYDNSITFEDWIEMKKQDSIQAANRFINK